MLPISLNLSAITVLLAGGGAPLLKRLKQIDESGAGEVKVFSAQPDIALRERAGKRLVERLPGSLDLDGAALMLVAGLNAFESKHLATLARSRRILVNVEDVPELCDFYYPAVLRRGDLTVAVSTGGASPTLAREIRKHLEAQFGAEWAERTRALAVLRQAWKAEGHGMKEVAEMTVEYIARQGWLEERVSCLVSRDSLKNTDDRNTQHETRDTESVA